MYCVKCHAPNVLIVGDFRVGESSVYSLTVGYRSSSGSTSFVVPLNNSSLFGDGAFLVAEATGMEYTTN